MSGNQEWMINKMTTNLEICWQQNKLNKTFTGWVGLFNSLGCCHTVLVIVLCLQSQYIMYITNGEYRGKSIVHK